MAKKFPKVTVLLPTYNRPDYLKSAVRSVVQQSMNEWELIIVNDGGEDVDPIIDRFCDDRIRYFNRGKNRGKASCLNFGLKQACCKYVAYIDDDDIWYSNHLEVLSRALDENPDVGGVYSDLYAVNFVRDETTGKRYPLHKRIQAARDFNRDALFVKNYVLHVSLMHRKEMALLAGGYDETVSVYIDWNMARKLSFYTDFRHISSVTGEYYLSPFKGGSDRISDLQRKDTKRYAHNLRKIKADLPAEPWPKVDRIAVIFPVYDWTDSVKTIVAGLVDNISYPARFVIVNNDVKKDEPDCRQALGEMGSLKNIRIVTPKKALTELEAYRFGADKVQADFVYLPSRRMDPKLAIRLITARRRLKKTKKKVRVYRHHFGKESFPPRGAKKRKCEGIKWDVEKERGSPFDVLIGKDRFLQLTDPAAGEMMVDIALIPTTPAKDNFKIFPTIPPNSFEFEFFFSKALEQHENGNEQSAFNLLQKAESIKRGGAGDAFLIDLHFKLCLALGKYGRAENKLRHLIRNGYAADNWVRLGTLLQKKKAFIEAIDAYQKGLVDIGLNLNDLESSVFPIVFSADFDAFTALVGLGECLLESGDLPESARMFRRASKLKADSHLPFMGFGKVFIKGNDLDRAEEAFIAAINRNKEDPGLYRLLGSLYEKRKQPDMANRYYHKASQSTSSPTTRISL